MVPADHPITQFEATANPWLLRALPLALMALATAAAFALGLPQQLTLESLVQHRADIDAFMEAHSLTAIAVYVALYIGAVALSIPCSAILTISGGLLFGTLIGGLAATTGATIGAVIVFLIARGAIGEWLACRAGRGRITRLATDFRAHAFNYVFFLRLVPVFPFWLVNLLAAVGRVALVPFVTATGIGVMPAAFVYAFFGSGLDSALSGQEAAYHDCLAAGGPVCRLAFDFSAALTPRLLFAFAGLGVLALLPIALRHAGALWIIRREFERHLHAGHG